MVTHQLTHSTSSDMRILVDLVAEGTEHLQALLRLVNQQCRDLDKIHTHLIREQCRRQYSETLA